MTYPRYLGYSSIILYEINNIISKYYVKNASESFVSNNSGVLSLHSELRATKIWRRFALAEDNSSFPRVRDTGLTAVSAASGGAARAAAGAGGGGSGVRRLAASGAARSSERCTGRVRRVRASVQARRYVRACVRDEIMWIRAAARRHARYVHIHTCRNCARYNFSEATPHLSSRNRLDCTFCTRESARCSPLRLVINRVIFFRA